MINVLVLLNDAVHWCILITL